MASDLHRVRRAIKQAILSQQLSGDQFLYWRAGLQQALTIVNEELERPEGADLSQEPTTRFTRWSEANGCMVRV